MTLLSVGVYSESDQLVAFKAGVFVWLAADIVGILRAVIGDGRVIAAHKAESSARRRGVLGVACLRVALWAVAAFALIVVEFGQLCEVSWDGAR